MTRENFLQPELRCGFEVDAFRKKIWKIELDMLEEFIALCDRHNLRWFLIAGSLIGAIRHKGFIPWDDDIDIAMFRDDYIRFLRIASKELKHPLFLQSTYTEAACPYEFAKIHNSETTAIDTVLAKQGRDINAGIFIDIFPIDGVDDSVLAKESRFRARIGLLRYTPFPKPTSFKGCVYWCVSLICRALGFNRLLSNLRIRSYQKAPVDTCTKCGLVTFAPANKRFEWDLSLFDREIEVPFEYMRVKVPAQYDAILKSSYGEWRQFVRGSSFHDGTTIFDPERPFKDVRKELFGF